MKQGKKMEKVDRAQNAQCWILRLQKLGIKRGGGPPGPPGSACAFRQNSFNEARTLPHNKPTYIPLVRLEIHRDYYSEHCSNWNYLCRNKVAGRHCEIPSLSTVLSYIVKLNLFSAAWWRGVLFVTMTLNAAHLQSQYLLFGRESFNLAELAFQMNPKKDCLCRWLTTHIFCMFYQLKNTDTVKIS